LYVKHPDIFSYFSPDLDWIEDAGEEATTNRELEVRLGSRAEGLVLPERGPGVVALANVLEVHPQFSGLCAANVMADRCHESGERCHSHGWDAGMPYYFQV
jgi:hypothetical protein